MREYKFRAWLKKEKKMVEVLSINFQEKRISVPANGDIRRPNFYDFDGVVLMQYTGLKDKNGTEIYESDILDDSYISCLSKGKVIKHFIATYKNAMFFGELIGKTPYGDMPLYHLIKTKVIGNIYENPELLEVL